MKDFKKILLFLMVLVIAAGVIYTPTPAEAAYDYGVTGDVNGDDTVSSNDYMLVKACFMNKSVSDVIKLKSDINGDGTISTADYFLVKKIFKGLPVQVMPKKLDPQPAVNDPGGSFTVKVNGTFTNNMVIQRNRYINVFGTASKVGGVVYVNFGGETRYAVVDSSGNWSVLLNAQKENTTAQSMKIYTKAQGVNGGITLSNILIGDVWIIAGQSNAQISLNGTLVNNTSYASSISTADNIRLYTQWFWDCSNYWGDFAVSNNKYVAITNTPQVNPPSNTKWLVGDQTNAKGFSAVGYYFAKKVSDNTNVPLGIIQCVAGGSALCDFMPKSGYVASKHNEGSSQFNACDVYNALIHPFSKTEIAGMIFYQGEGNESAHSTYSDDLTDFVGMMRGVFGKNMPFYNVQLPSHNTNGNWPGLADVRFEQFDAIKTIDKYYLASTMYRALSNKDTDWAHPTYKQHIGENLAYLALANIYNYSKFPINDYGAPEFTSVTVKDGYAYLYFKNVSTGLKAGSNGAVKGFTNYATGAALTATIEGTNCVKVKMTTGLKTIAYGDSAMATSTTHNLRNAKGYYALAFRCNV